MQRFIDLLKDTHGATAIEYGLILAMIFLAIVTGVSAVGAGTIDVMNDIAEAWRAA
jgi:pilus assembly protein Flp/PilA